jgi:DNA (cytosine-5)-methyltransferase 1
MGCEGRKPLSFLDFFAGVGGFRAGLEQAGMRCLGHCEIDKFADRSYRAIHDLKEGEFFAADIRSIVPADLPDADCYAFGFPCQPFSISGQRKSFEDMRGTLIFEVLRLAAARKPPILFGDYSDIGIIGVTPLFEIFRCYHEKPETGEVRKEKSE